LENSNIRLLGYLHFGFRNLLTTEGNEVKSVEDMEGLDVRSPESWVWTQMFKEWGANPTPVTLGEAYSSVQTGVVDGLENPASVNTDNKYYEVTDNLTLTEHMFGTINFVINNDTYESLSEEQQETLDELSQEALKDANENIMRPRDEEAFEELEEKLNIIELDDLEKWESKVQ